MEGTRGSDRLKHLRKQELTEEQLDRLAGLADRDGIRLVGWRPRGQPPQIDALLAHYIVPPQEFADLMQQLAHEKLLNHIVVFPIGIVNPEEFQVQLRLGD